MTKLLEAITAMTRAMNSYSQTTASSTSINVVVLVEQHRFLSEAQNEDQSITEFVAVLQKRQHSAILYANVKSQ